MIAQISPCCNAQIIPSTFQGVTFGYCYHCEKQVTRINPTTGYEEWLDGSTLLTTCQDLRKVEVSVAIKCNTCHGTGLFFNRVLYPNLWAPCHGCDGKGYNTHRFIPFTGAVNIPGVSAVFIKRPPEPETVSYDEFKARQIPPPFGNQANIRWPTL